jgi:hypothetical protein
MSLSLAVNARNDLTLSSDGNLSLSSELDATMQACAHAARTLLGEMIYATDQGIPNFQVVWSGAPNVPQFEAYLRRQLLAVEGVEQILSIDVAVSDNVLSYRAVIQTIYGTGSLNG